MILAHCILAVVIPWFTWLGLVLVVVAMSDSESRTLDAAVYLMFMLHAVRPLGRGNNVTFAQGRLCPSTASPP